MFEVTESAAISIKEYLDANSIESPIRVALMQGG